MDPYECALSAFLHYLDGDIEDSKEYTANYTVWRRQRGFKPEMKPRLASLAKKALNRSVVDCDDAMYSLNEILFPDME